MSEPVAARLRRDNRAQRPTQSAPIGTPQQSNAYNNQTLNFAVHGHKARLHARAESRGKSRTGWQQQGPLVANPPSNVPTYHPAANVFAAANQEQLLAAYVAMMQSASDSPTAYPQQVFGSHEGGNSSLAYFHTAVIDWNGLLSRQGSVPASNRIADLMGLLPQPKFSMERPEGSAPDTPESLMKATHMNPQQQQQQQYLNTAQAAAYIAPYAYQQHFSSYWTAAAAAAQPGSPVIGPQMLPTQGSSSSTRIHHQNRRLSSFSGADTSGSSSGGSTAYYSCDSGSGAHTPTFADSPASAAYSPAAAAAGIPASAGSYLSLAAPVAYQPWQQQQQQLWPIWVPGPGSPVCDSPQQQGSWSPVYAQQYMLYMQHMQFLQQQQQQQQYAAHCNPEAHYMGCMPSGSHSWQQQQQQQQFGYFGPGLYRTGSDPSVLHSWRQQQQQRAHRRWQQQDRGSYSQRGSSCPGGGSSSSSKNGRGSSSGGGVKQQRCARRPSRLAAMTHGIISKPDCPMSAIPEGDGTLVATIPIDVAPPPVVAAAAAAGAGEEAGAVGTSSETQKPAASIVKVVGSCGTACKDKHIAEGKPDCQAGSSSSRPDFFMSHSGSGANDRQAASSAAAAAAEEPLSVKHIAAPKASRDQRRNARSGSGQHNPAAGGNRPYQASSNSGYAAAIGSGQHCKERQVWQRPAPHNWQPSQQQQAGAYSWHQQQQCQQPQQPANPVNWLWQPPGQQRQYPVAALQLPYIVSNSGRSSYMHSPSAAGSPAASAAASHSGYFKYSPVNHQQENASPQANARPDFSSNERRNNSSNMRQQHRHGSSSGGGSKLPQLVQLSPYRTGSADHDVFYNACYQWPEMHAAVQQSSSSHRLVGPGSQPGSARSPRSSQRHNMQGSHQHDGHAAAEYGSQGAVLARECSTTTAAALAAAAAGDKHVSWGVRSRRQSSKQQNWKHHHLGNRSNNGDRPAGSRSEFTSRGFSSYNMGGGSRNGSGFPTAGTEDSSLLGAGTQRQTAVSRTGSTGAAAAVRVAEDTTPNRTSGHGAGALNTSKQLVLPPIKTGREVNQSNWKRCAAAGAQQAGGILGQAGSSNAAVARAGGDGMREQKSVAGKYDGALLGGAGAGGQQPRLARGRSLRSPVQRI